MRVDVDKFLQELRYENCDVVERDDDYSYSCAWGYSEELILKVLNNQTKSEQFEWVDRYNNKYDNQLYVCSSCGNSALYKAVQDDLGRWVNKQFLSDYCPYCGKKRIK